MRGARRYSAEIVIGPGDRIILDDDSISNLEARANCLVPATVYSRALAGEARPLALRDAPVERERSGASRSPPRCSQPGIIGVIGGASKAQLAGS